MRTSTRRVLNGLLSAHCDHCGMGGLTPLPVMDTDLSIELECECGHIREVDKARAIVAFAGRRVCTTK